MTDFKADLCIKTLALFAYGGVESQVAITATVLYSSSKDKDKRTAKSMEFRAQAYNGKDLKKKMNRLYEILEINDETYPKTLKFMRSICEAYLIYLETCYKHGIKVLPISLGGHQGDRITVSRQGIKLHEGGKVGLIWAAGTSPESLLIKAPEQPDLYNFYDQMKMVGRSSEKTPSALTSKFESDPDYCATDELKEDPEDPKEHPAIAAFAARLEEMTDDDNRPLERYTAFADSNLRFWFENGVCYLSPGKDAIQNAPKINHCGPLNGVRKNVTFTVAATLLQDLERDKEHTAIFWSNTYSAFVVIQSYKDYLSSMCYQIKPLIFMTCKHGGKRYKELLAIIRHYTSKWKAVQSAKPTRASTLVVKTDKTTGQLKLKNGQVQFMEDYALMSSSKEVQQTD